MSPLEGITGVSGVGALRVAPLRQTSADEHSAAVAVERTAPTPTGPDPATAASAPVARQRPFLSPLSPQAVIRQAELLLQITATAASSPALREIAAAAYQMEIDARREMARARLEGMTAGRQWFA
ncbi:MAG TPA: hypothetical protein VMU36_05880 [Spirochaetia bacterium]|nr:hypothetical protein [Spirochaetia bacterium]